MRKFPKLPMVMCHVIVSKGRWVSLLKLYAFVFYPNVLAELKFG